MIREGNMDNKRRYLRLDVQKMGADISDDVGFCSARVKDISRFGICLTEIPRKLHVKGNKFLVVISDQDHRFFKMQVEGRWEKAEGFDTIMGAEIKNAPWSWTELLAAMEPEDSNVWGAAR